jgi:DNA processing protein
MVVNTLTLKAGELPKPLRQVDPPPKQLYWAGVKPESVLAKPRVGVVGSRKATAYGRNATFDLTVQLSRAGVIIVSGLAFGVDSYAHRAALEAGGLTVAVLPRAVSEVYPASHHHLAKQILNSGGVLISEYPPGTDARRENFIARNRLISGLSDVLVITEAARNSGSLHTARFALEQGKTVMAVPGNINSPASEGCNNLIKSGALPVTSVDDIFFALKLKPNTQRVAKFTGGTLQQQKLFELIAGGTSEQEELVSVSQMAPAEVSSNLTSLELGGYIRPAGGGHWTTN